MGAQGQQFASVNVGYRLNLAGPARAGFERERMPAKTISDATFGRDVLRSETPVLVEFFARRGGYRKAVSELDEAAQGLEGRVKLAKLDVDRNPAVRNDYEIYTLPTLILFKNGKPTARRVGGLIGKDIEEWISAELMLALATQTASSRRRAAELELANGMHVVVIPDHRAPVVTHMICYKVGAADGPPGVSGIAHFLGHLMLKSTDNVAAGEFAKIISQLGGQYSAFVDRDVTAFVQRISTDHLKTAMEIEADRMVHLRLTNEEVDSERQVIIEERRSLYDNNPVALLDEQMNAVLYLSHPYGIPGGGWPDEIVRLSREDALRFYKRHYAPNNVVLVVSGDVTLEEVRRTVEETYGKIPASPLVQNRERRPSPSHLAPRRVTLKHPRVGDPAFRRDYLVPGYITAKPGDAETMELLAQILGTSPTGRLHSHMVLEANLASMTRCDYSMAADFGTISFYALSRHGDLSAVETGVDKVLDDIRNSGVTDYELARAKKALLASYVFNANNQEKLTLGYGLHLTIGRTLEQVEAWPATIAQVGCKDIKRVAKEVFELSRSVTGWLLQDGHSGNGHSDATS
jgi:zinc protease